MNSSRPPTAVLVAGRMHLSGQRLSGYHRPDDQTIWCGRENGDQVKRRLLTLGGVLFLALAAIGPLTAKAGAATGGAGTPADGNERSQAIGQLRQLLAQH